MADSRLKSEIDELLQTYVDLGAGAAIIVRQLRKTVNADVRRKLIAELRNADKKRIELLNYVERIAQPS
jgi:hypothetical protein